MLQETFDWDPGTLANTDIDLVLPLAAYYPYWRSRKKKNAQENKVYADEADWL